MSAPSVPCPVQNLCECCQQRPAVMLVHLPAAAYRIGEPPGNPGDCFRICGTTCAPPTGRTGADHAAARRQTNPAHPPPEFWAGPRDLRGRHPGPRPGGGPAAAAT